jgi:hypothetical protein
MTYPVLKVYNPYGEFAAACKEPGDAAALVLRYGIGSEVRYGHNRVIWHEDGSEQIDRESYLRAVMERIER